MKRTILMLTVISLLVGVTAIARNNVPGDVPTPDPLIVTIDGFTVTCTWAEVADKYSVVVEGVITVYDFYDLVEGDEIDVEVEVEIGSPVEEAIEFDLRDLKAAVIVELGLMGYLPEDIISANNDLAIVKVKGLDPSLLPVKRQNNLFATASLFPVD